MFGDQIQQSVVHVRRYTAADEETLNGTFFTLKEMPFVKKQLEQSLRPFRLDEKKAFGDRTVTVRTTHMLVGEKNENDGFIDGGIYRYKTHVLLGFHTRTVFKEFRMDLAFVRQVIEAIRIVEIIKRLMRKPAVHLFDSVLAIKCMQSMAQWDSFEEGYGRLWTKADILLEMYNLFDFGDDSWCRMFRHVCIVFGMP